MGPFASTATLLSEITPPGVDSRLINVDPAALAAAGLTLPMMIDEPSEAILSSRPGTRARAAGLTTRTAGETAAAVRAWYHDRGRPPLTKGPTRDQEAALIRAHRRE